MLEEFLVKKKTKHNFILPHCPSVHMALNSWLTYMSGCVRVCMYIYTYIQYNRRQTPMHCAQRLRLNAPLAPSHTPAQCWSQCGSRPAGNSPLIVCLVYFIFSSVILPTHTCPRPRAIFALSARRGALVYEVLAQTHAAQRMSMQPVSICYLQ